MGRKECNNDSCFCDGSCYEDGKERDIIANFYEKVNGEREKLPEGINTLIRLNIDDLTIGN